MYSRRAQKHCQAREEQVSWQAAQTARTRRVFLRARQRCISTVSEQPGPSLQAQGGGAQASKEPRQEAKLVLPEHNSPYGKCKHARISAGRRALDQTVVRVHSPLRREAGVVPTRVEDLQSDCALWKPRHVKLLARLLPLARIGGLCPETFRTCRSGNGLGGLQSWRTGSRWRYHSQRPRKCRCEPREISPGEVSIPAAIGNTADASNAAATSRRRLASFARSWGPRPCAAGSSTAASDDTSFSLSAAEVAAAAPDMTR